MILSKEELQQYRALAGMQLKYAEDGDSHKVADCLIMMIRMIQQFAKKKLKEKTGYDWDNAEFSEAAKDQYASMVGDGLVAASDGWEAWVKAQINIENWISGYIEQALIQATATLDLKQSRN